MAANFQLPDVMKAPYTLTELDADGNPAEPLVWRGEDWPGEARFGWARQGMVGQCGVGHGRAGQGRGSKKET